MQQLRGDLFNPDSYSLIHEGGLVTPTMFERPDAICITTNGFVKKNGEAVMGRGCAKRAAELMPGLPEALGNAISAQGNRTYVHGPYNGMQIVTFPVKAAFRIYDPFHVSVVRHMKSKFKTGDRVPGWALVADPKIIKRSADQLVAEADAHGWESVVLPRPGCGAGELSWKEIGPMLHSILDDRFYAITF